MDKIDLVIIVSMLVGYLIFSLIDELADRFIYKVKRIGVSINAEDYKELKKIVKANFPEQKVDKWLRFQFKEDIKEYLEHYGR